MLESSLSPTARSSEFVKTNQVIITNDGVELVADIYIPGGKPPFPAIVEITPYSARQQNKLGEIYATRGYLFVAVDARGRYRSSGEWKPMEYDQADGHAVLQWVAKHKLCNGRIGTRGHSYCGYNQLLAAIDAPSALQAMVVCVAPGDVFINVPFHGGAYDMSDFMWLLTMTGRVCDDGGGNEYLGIKRFGAEEFEENPYEQEADQDVKQAREAVQEKLQQQQLENLARALASRPFQQMDMQFGIRQNQFREWIQHWRFDEYWQQRSVLPRLSRTDVPTLHISGWWDANGRGATTFYRGMRDRAATTVNREKQRLLMGAWDHYMQAPDCDDLPPEEASQVDRAALRDELNDELAWFDQHLKDVSSGPATAARVTLFITGIYQWFDFDDWPPASTKETTYYLVAHKENGYGCLQPTAADGVTTSSSYTFDPRNPTPFAAYDLLLDKAPFDNSQLHSSREDILIFETPVIDYTLALVGEISLVLYASADVPDFDLCAKLMDVYPDGRAIYLADGIIRARFREGWQQPENPRPGTNHRYTLDLWHIGHVLRSGHRLRLELASAAFGRFDVNPCTGTDIATETESQIANITIQHNITYPSHIILPVCDDTRLTNGGS